jgi:hypothetical protein
MRFIASMHFVLKNKLSCVVMGYTGRWLQTGLQQQTASAAFSFACGIKRAERFGPILLKLATTEMVLIPLPLNFIL